MTSSWCGSWIGCGVVRLPQAQLLFALDKICFRDIIIGWILSLVELHRPESVL